uniref:Uncharacterized protein n=1 Tax=Odontella aurita TaxID=265563 RepID=A0A7S4JMI4_9STRA
MIRLLHLIHDQRNPAQGPEDDSQCTDSNPRFPVRMRRYPRSRIDYITVGAAANLHGLPHKAMTSCDRWRASGLSKFGGRRLRILALYMVVLAGDRWRVARRGNRLCAYVSCGHPTRNWCSFRNLMICVCRSKEEGGEQREKIRESVSIRFLDN